MYRIMATVTKNTPEGTITRQIPSFEIDGNLHGIFTEQGIYPLVNAIVNCFNDDNIKVSVTYFK